MPLNTVYFCMEEAYNGYYKFFVCIPEMLFACVASALFADCTRQEGATPACTEVGSEGSGFLTPPGLKVRLLGWAYFWDISGLYFKARFCKCS